MEISDCLLCPAERFIGEVHIPRCRLYVGVSHQLSYDVDRQPPHFEDLFRMYGGSNMIQGHRQRGISVPHLLVHH